HASAGRCSSAPRGDEPNCLRRWATERLAPPLAPHAARDWSLKAPCQALFLSASQNFEGVSSQPPSRLCEGITLATSSAVGPSLRGNFTCPRSPPVPPATPIAKRPASNPAIGMYDHPQNAPALLVYQLPRKSPSSGLGKAGRTHLPPIGPHPTPGRLLPPNYPTARDTPSPVRAL